MPLFSKVKDIFQRGSSAKKKKSYHNVFLDNPEENWLIVGELGDGAYGKVYKAHHKFNGTHAALKQLELEGEEDLESFMIEIDILSECKHPNIVELIEAYHYDGKLWMYLEYCDGGALDSIIVDLDRPLNEKQIAYVCRELCQALVYIHSQKVIHRDLKAGNVLLTMEGGVKLADFGVSAKNKNTLDKRGTFIGTPYWLAPEVILCETFFDANYDYKADIWSLGISLIEFAQMDPPHHEVSPVRVMLKIQKSEPPKLDFPSRWSKEFNDFIGKCLIKDPTQRPDAEELLKHPFINKEISLKPLRDLLLEYNAEVEEVVEEESEDQDNSRGSIVSELMTNIDNLDKDASLKSAANKLPSTAEETTLTSSAERKVSKGPAPLPPIVTTTAQPPQPKKGPAPAAPVTPPSIVSEPTPPTTSKLNSKSIDKISTYNTVVTSNFSPISVTASNFENTPSESKVDGDGRKDVSSTNMPSLPSQQQSSPSTKDSHIPGISHRDIIPKRDTDLVIIESKTKVETDINDKSDALNITVNSMDVKAINVSNGSEAIPISLESEQNDQTFRSHNKQADESSPISGAGDINDTRQQQIQSENGTISVPVILPLNEKLDFASASSQGILDDKMSVPTTETSEVLLTSISSEGTVIVRTPTPTPGLSAEVPPHPVAPKMENLVICTVAEEICDGLRPLTPPGDHILPKATPPESPHVDSSEAWSRIPSVSTPAIASPTQTLSMSEAEAHAVLILENAINSAVDTSSSFRVSDECSLNSSLPRSPSLKDKSFGDLVSAKGEVVVVASEQEREDELDQVGHKLDESEVVVLNSSILQEEVKDKSPEFMVNVEDVTDQKLVSPQVASHISVVSIEEDEKDADFNRQISLTIEGTTVGATDVDDDLDSQNISCQSSSNTISTSNDSGIAKDSPLHSRLNEKDNLEAKEEQKSLELTPESEGMGPPTKPISNGVRRQSSRGSDRSDIDTISSVSSDKENRHRFDDSDFGDEVIFRTNSLKRARASPELSNKLSDARNAKNKELQESIALRKKTRKRTRRFEIDGVLISSTTSKVIYGEDEEAHLVRKQELREIKILQKQEQKQFQDLSAKAELGRFEQERKFENERVGLTRNYDSQIENLNRQQKQQVERAEVKQESELKIAGKKIRSEQERELKTFRESLKQEMKLLKYEVDLLPKDKRKEILKVRKEKLDHEQAEREKGFFEKLNENHEMSLKRLNDEHREHIALKERQFLEEKHQMMRSRENALWEMEERHIHDKHQLAKEQLKDVYFLQRHQMLIRHNKELEQVRRFNQQKEEALLKRQQIERRQLPRRIRQEMKTREKMFREKIRISMTTLPSQEDEKEQLRGFQELEKIKYDAERKRAEKKHHKQLEELRASTEYALKELEILQNEKGKILMEHETYKLRLLDEDYHKELREWKANLIPRKQKLEEAFEKQLSEQERFYGDYLNRGMGATPSQSSHSLARSITS